MDSEAECYYILYVYGTIHSITINDFKKALLAPSGEPPMAVYIFENARQSDASSGVADITELGNWLQCRIFEYSTSTRRTRVGASGYLPNPNPGSRGPNIRFVVHWFEFDNLTSVSTLFRRFSSNDWRE